MNSLIDKKEFIKLPEFIYSKLKEDDIDEVLNFVLLFKKEYLYPYISSIEEAKNKIKAEYFKKNYIAYIARKNNRIQGFFMLIYII